MCLSTSRYSQYSPLLHVTHLLLATNIWPGVFAQNIWPGIFAKWFVQFPISWFFRTMFLTLLILLLFLWNHIRFPVWQILNTFCRFLTVASSFTQALTWETTGMWVLLLLLHNCWNKKICENWPNDIYLLFAPSSKASKQVFFSKVKMRSFTNFMLRKMTYLKITTDYESAPPQIMDIIVVSCSMVSFYHTIAWVHFLT